MRLEPEDDAGPPPPPFVRRRRRRRNALLATAALIIAGVPLVLGVIGNGEDPADDAPVAGPDGGADPEGDARTGEPQPETGEELLDPPEPTELDGVDAIYAALLRDIDASELAMIRFQDALSEAFGDASADDEERLTATIQEAATAGQQGLDEARERLVDPLEDEGAEAVRESYLQHLESWVTYMAAVEEDPGILAVEDRTRAYTLSINVTADAFARTLEDQLPSDVAGEVRRFADGILDRGFRGFGESNV